MLENVAAQIEKLHTTKAARAEMTAVQQAVDVGGVEGTGAMIYTFSDGSSICFLGVACFQIQTTVKQVF